MLPRAAADSLPSARTCWAGPCGALRNFPGLTFYNQAFAFDPGQNPLGLTASNGGSGTIGF